jgi:hypothetical protein
MQPSVRCAMQQPDDTPDADLAGANSQHQRHRESQRFGVVLRAQRPSLARRLDYVSLGRHGGQKQFRRLRGFCAMKRLIAALDGLSINSGVELRKQVA